MPVYEYVCASRHLTPRLFRGKPAPKSIKCEFHHGTGNPGQTHAEGCAEWHVCGRRATRTITMPAVIFRGDGFTGAGKDAHTR